MIKLASTESAAAQALVQAMASGNEEEMTQAWQAFHASVAAQVTADFEELRESQDASVLASRGYRQLTAKENAWYQRVIEALQSPRPKQAFAEIIGSDDEKDLMPETIIEDVFRDLEDEFPLLNAIDFQFTSYSTKWVLNDHTVQTAVWGTITDEIAKEITSAFRVIDIQQSKLSAFAVIENGMLDLGPTFLDSYIRTCLKQALLMGLETAIVKGTGKDEPVGLIRDIHKGVSFNSETGYPAKKKTSVTGFAPAEYGALLAKLAKNENEKTKKFAKVYMVCNMTDYLTKIMPATTVLNANGQYVNNLFPFPTEVVVSNVLTDGDAVMFVPGEYTCFVGAGIGNTGKLETTDQYKFLEDLTHFKIKMYGAGQAIDDTSALYLDISKLEPAYIAIKDMSEPGA